MILLGTLWPLEMNEFDGQWQQLAQVMWIVTKEWNRCLFDVGPIFFDMDCLEGADSCLFEDTENSLDQLKSVFLLTLLDWSRCWGSSDCSFILEFLASLRPTI